MSRVTDIPGPIDPTEPSGTSASKPPLTRKDGVVVIRSIHNRIYNVAGMVGGAVIAALFVVFAHSLVVRIVAGLIGLGLLAWAVRGARVGIECEPEQLVIREMTRTHRVPWDEVLGVTTRYDPRFKILAPAVMVYADEAHGGRRGGRLSAMSVADKKRPLIEGRVRTLTEQWRAHVADSSR